MEGLVSLLEHNNDVNVYNTECKVQSHLPPVPSLNIKDPDISQWLALSVQSPSHK